MDGAAFDHLNERYGYETWRVPQPRDEYLHVWQFRLSAVALPGWRAQRMQVVPPQPPWPRSVQSVWSAEHNSDLLASVFVFECPDRTGARAVLLQALGNFQAVVERREGPGETAFGLPNHTAVLFAVANVVLLARNAGREVASMLAVAGALERHLTERPAAGGKVVPDIEIFASGELKPDAKVVPLVVEATDPLERPLWFKLFSRTGEVLEEHNRLVFRPGAAGPHEITLYAISEDGGVATRTLALREDASSPPAT